MVDLSAEIRWGNDLDADLRCLAKEEGILENFRPMRSQPRDIDGLYAPSCRNRAFYNGESLRKEVQRVTLKAVWDSRSGSSIVTGTSQTYTRNEKIHQRVPAYWTGVKIGWEAAIGARLRAGVATKNEKEDSEVVVADSQLKQKVSHILGLRPILAVYMQR